MKKRLPLHIEDVIEPTFKRRSVPLKDAYPEVAIEWCFRKNCGWGPEDFSRASNVNAWWTCPKCRNDYKARILSRTLGKSACPYCCTSGKRVAPHNSLATLYPDVAAEWHPTKNKLSPSDYVAASDERVWWQCSANKEHSWFSKISIRTKAGASCPKCYDDFRSTDRIARTIVTEYDSRKVKREGFQE